MINVSTVGLAECLDAEGFPLPKECREARLIMGVDACMMLQFDVFVTPDTMARLGRALQRFAESVRDQQSYEDVNNRQGMR